MSVKVDAEYLRENIEHHIERLGRNQRLDKKYTTWITLYNAFSGAAITAAIGVSQYVPSLETALQILAILLGATQAIINAYGSLFGHKRLWIIAAQSRRRFFELREDLTHSEKTGNLDESTLSELYERYKDGLKRENSAWDELRERD
ncbi:SLATT domain-containing protein [Cognatiyoonia sp. IB215446]|uniref:SLATT domain-containing protein n=1 Tax=Cognatiyoonia sp. IB215446 TaxID=3097355 RepID=UPI002A0B0597|nr:SLATT domain-containing protein [Cognatiyoonia sp. IB215446]MDX8347386.1 SLATT domain-containing protein [Cognatiyoonia sp. IB215446]